MSNPYEDLVNPVIKLEKQIKALNEGEALRWAHMTNSMAALNKKLDLILEKLACVSISDRSSNKPKRS